MRTLRTSVSQTAILCVPAVPQRADHRVVDTIEQLVTRILEGNLSPKERAVLKEEPAYW
jgi:arginine/serine-rich splicing factor 14